MFLTFKGYAYYPEAGWNDFCGSFDTIEQALTHLLEVNGDWWQVVDLNSMTIVKEGHN